MIKTKDTYCAELESAKQRLKELGRDFEIGQDARTDNYSGVNCDFELPYSTLPTLQVEKWKD